jgi:adenine-specific DNA-methyltransferase
LLPMGLGAVHSYLRCPPMPELTWLGKDKIRTHHHDVPFRVLEPQYTVGNPDPNGSRIIYGDNLEALKALLPEYEGQIKCIYIDPPYNTGNENWVYNDNVSHPRLQRWLGKVVGKESEDLTRHDKWLCMMYPRLVLLHQLLADDGVIFVSIDDNEQASLKLIMDEIWGRGNFISSLVWKSRQNKDNRNVNKVSNDHEFILCYGMTLKGHERTNSNYSNPDNDVRGPWTSANMVGLLDEKQRPNLHYELVHPTTGVNYGKPNMGWRYDKNTMRRLIEEDRIIWPASIEGRPRKKQFLAELREGVTGYSSIVGDNIFTRNGTSVIQDIFGTRSFDFPKPYELVQELINQATGPNDIILDSFAGSGTTAHAVLNLNKQDGGSRKFILIEMEDYAETITAERVRRVINGYGNTNGTGGSFTYYELGQPLFTDESLLNETVPLDRIRAYIWYSETKAPQPIPALDPNETPYFLGLLNGTAYYFCYEPDALTTLDYTLLSTVRTRADQYIIYADNCLLAREWMQERHIVFKKIPRDISRF